VECNDDSGFISTFNRIMIYQFKAMKSEGFILMQTKK